MISVKCPRCARQIGVKQPPANGLLACGDCGQKFRVQLPAAQSARPAEAVEELEEAVLVEDEAPAAPKKPKFAPLDDDDDTPGAVPVPKRKKPKFEALDDEPADEAGADAEDEPRPKKKKKKKKKKVAEGPPNIKGAHVALVAGGIGFVLVFSFVAYLMWKGVGSKPKANPDEVIAEITKINGMVQRDPATNEVKSIGLSGTEGRGHLLSKIKDAFPNLHTLNLSNTLVSDIDLEHLEDYKNLRVLRLGHTKVTSGGIQFLKGLTGLEELDLTQALVHDMALEDLKGLKNLKRIGLSGTFANGRALAAAIPGLKIDD